MRRALLFVLLTGCVGDGASGAGGPTDGTSGTTTTAATTSTSSGPSGSTSDEVVTDTGATGDTGETGLSRCPNGSVRLETQADVPGVAGCVEFPGDVEVGEAVTDLTPLAGVRRIAGTLRVGTFYSENPAMLTSFAGLESLESLGGLVLEPVPVPDLLPLSALTEVTGMVSIRRLELTSLEGLHNLTAIGTSLEVEGCEALVDLTGLRGLQRVGERIDLDGLAITDLHGLEQLTEVGAAGGKTGEVILRDLGQLESLDGLHIAWHDSIDFFLADTAVSDLGVFADATALAAISLHANALLTDLAGLESLVSVDSLYFNGNALADLGALAGLQSIGTLRIQSEPLADLSPLPALKQIGQVHLASNAELTGLGLLAGVSSLESLSLTDNDALVALPGLSALTSVKQDLDIRGNAQLTSLAGVAALTAVGGRLRIVSNHALPHADALAWAAAITVGGGSKIADNKDGPPPQDPCPWFQDGECDEPILCPELSDGLDCCQFAGCE